ncbi:MAG: heme ABC exporter ATP-binding protein CcmA [Gammaproteobacteria bacterium]
MEDWILRVANLAIRKGNRLLIKRFNLELHTGEFVHLQGDNGCGKTTLLKALMGIGSLASGSILWRKSISNGAHAFSGREVGYVGHANALKPLLSVRENLQMPASGRPIDSDQMATVLAQAQLEPLADLLVQALSAGQKRRVALAGLLLRPTRLWILDEPFAALDASASAHWLQLCRDFCRQGGTVLFTAHQLKLDGVRSVSVQAAPS